MKLDGSPSPRSKQLAWFVAGTPKYDTSHARPVCVQFNLAYILASGRRWPEVQTCEDWGALIEAAMRPEPVDGFCLVRPGTAGKSLHRGTYRVQPCHALLTSEDRAMLMLPRSTRSWALRAYPPLCTGERVQEAYRRTPAGTCAWRGSVYKALPCKCTVAP